MQNIRAFYKFLIFSFYACCYFFEAFLILKFSNKNRYQIKGLLVQIIQKYAWKTKNLLGVETTFLGSKIDLNKLQNTLIVSNHLSYLDVIIMAAYMPACFVTSIEMRETFFLGQICESGGCLYVERRNKSNIKEEIKDITNALSAGLNVIIYPEATSTNAEEVKRFKRPLFQAAIDSGAKVLPMTLNYRWINFESFNLSNRDTICWYGDMEFLPHFWNLLKQESLKLEINIAKTYAPEPEDAPADLALMSHGIVNSYFRPVEASLH